MHLNWGKIDTRKVQMLAESGHDDAFMAKFFNVSRARWEKLKENSPTFSRYLHNWKQIYLDRVEKALYQRAIGYEYTEQTFEKTGAFSVLIDMDTKDLTFEPEYRKKVVVKQMAPDVAACQYVLNNRKPEEWQTQVKVAHESSDFSKQLQAASERVALLPDAGQVDILAR